VGGGGIPARRDFAPDYILLIRQNIPISVVEAKAEYKGPAAGLQQAIQYAEMMGVMFAYSSNGN
jgi:type I restriction enzyme R subunit